MVRFESGGRHFQLERDFARKGKKTRLFCLDDGEELSEESGDLQALLLDLDAAGFENTVAVGQLKVRPGEELFLCSEKIMRPTIMHRVREIWTWRRPLQDFRSEKRR